MSTYQGTLIIDKPDNRDFQVEHLLGKAKGAIPKSINLLKEITIHDQQQTNHCSAYSLTHIHQLLNTIERTQKVTLNPEEQWANQKKYPATASEKLGDYLQSALKSLQKYGLKYNNQTLNIDGYAKVKKEDFKTYLASGLPIYTGTPYTKTNYITAKNTGTWGGLDNNVTGGHAVCIVGYHDTGYIALTSWGQTWGKYNNGTFTIKYSDIDQLYSSYIIYDTQDFKLIFRDVSENSPLASDIQWATEKGLVKGYGDSSLPNKEKMFLPDRPISRAEICVVMKRFYNLLK